MIKNCNKYEERNKSIQPVSSLSRGCVLALQFYFGETQQSYHPQSKLYWLPNWRNWEHNVELLSVI